MKWSRQWDSTGFWQSICPIWMESLCLGDPSRGIMAEAPCLVSGIQQVLDDSVLRICDRTCAGASRVRLRIRRIRWGSLGHNGAVWWSLRCSCMSQFTLEALLLLLLLLLLFEVKHGHVIVLANRMWSAVYHFAWKLVRTSAVCHICVSLPWWF